MTKYISALICAAAAVLLVIRPAEVSQAVCGAVYDCLDVIIPSLFAFTVLAVYLQGSGAARILLKPLTLPLSRLLRLDEELCCVVLLSNLGGYPVGARLLTGMVKNGRLSGEDAGRLLCCCYGSGPAFVVGIAGVRIYGSAAVGGVIYAACLLSSLTAALVVCRSGKPVALSSSGSAPRLGLVEAAKSGASVMMTVCTMIVAFAVISALLDISGVMGLLTKIPALLGAGENAEAVIRSLLEVSRIKGLTPSAPWVAPLCAGLLTLGGACVLMQIAAIAEGRIPLRGFFISRIPTAALSGLLSLPALLLPEAAVECIGGTPTAAEPFSLNLALSVCVLIMSGMLLCLSPRARGGK